MFGEDHLQLVGMFALALGPPMTLTWAIARWGFHQMMRRQDETNAHLKLINGRLDRHDEDWQAQRELNAWFAAKLGEPPPLRRDQSLPGAGHDSQKEIADGAAR